MRTLLAMRSPRNRAGLAEQLVRRRGIELTAQCGTGPEAAQILAAARFDLFIACHRLPVMTSLDVVATLPPERRPATIIEADSPEGAAEAFALGVVDFLVTPVSQPRRDLALDRAIDRITLERICRLSREVTSTEEPDGSAPMAATLDRLLVRTPSGMRIVHSCDVDWIEAANYYVRLHVNGTSYLLRETLTRLERSLGSGPFVRIHRSAVVNLDRVVRADGRGVLLRSGARVAVSRSRRASLERALARRLIPPPEYGV